MVQVKSFGKKSRQGDGRQVDLTPCRKRLVASLLAGALLLTGGVWANEPLEWKYDTSGRIEGTVSESAVPVTESFISSLAFTAWSVGFDLDTMSAFCLIIR